ncbi:MAG: ABC transporter substrate-binding protein, partial [Actinomycetota bacterium]|nr:ABC transporter substrate-binding protein [Actinomycetota bacterium]
VYNEQTTGATTEAVKKAASAAQVPVVPVTETLPDGKTFEQWMKSNADAIGAALDQAKP